MKNEQEAIEKLEEYGALHAVDCGCVSEDPDECDCEMRGIKAFVKEAWRAAWLSGYEEGEKFANKIGNATPELQRLSEKTDELLKELKNPSLTEKP